MAAPSAQAPDAFAAACAVLCEGADADTCAPLSPERTRAAAAAAACVAAASPTPADALTAHPALARRLGALACLYGDEAAQLAALRALAALLAAAAPPPAARAAAEQLAHCGALAAACGALCAPMERNVAAMALLGSCAAAAAVGAGAGAGGDDDGTDVSSLLRDALTSERTLRALVCALGGTGAPRVSAAAASCVAALARAFGADVAGRLCVAEAHAGAVLHGAALPLLLALAAHPDDAPARALEARCAPGARARAGAAGGGGGAAARAAAADALAACFAAHDAAAAAAGAQRGAVSALVRNLERAQPPEGEALPPPPPPPPAGVVRMPSSVGAALVSLLARAPAARAQLVAEPSLTVRLARLAAGPRGGAAANAACTALTALMRDEAALSVALGAARAVPGCAFTMRLPEQLEARVAPAFEAARGAEALARRTAAARESREDAAEEARDAAARAYDGRFMRLAVEHLSAAMGDDDEGGIEDAPAAAPPHDALDDRTTFAYCRAHVLAQRAALIAAAGCETAALEGDADVAALGCSLHTVLPPLAAAGAAAPGAAPPCYAHTLGLSVSAGAGGELLARTAGGAWLAPLARAVADAGATEMLQTASGVASAPLFDRGAASFALPEARARCLDTLFAGAGADGAGGAGTAVPADVAAAASALNWRFHLAAPGSDDAALLMRSSLARAFYPAYAGVPRAQLERVGEMTMVVNVDASLDACGDAHAATLRAALRALLCGAAAAAGHEACGCAACEEARGAGGMCGLPGCGVVTKLRRCGGCRGRAYCCPPHQAADWARHRPECRVTAVKS
jgi:hypothetical protein